MKKTTKIVLASILAAILGVGLVGGAVQAQVPAGDHGGHGWRGHHGHRGPMQRANFMRMQDAFFDQYDTNHDGQLTQAEIDQARKDRLAKYDADHDGKLNLQEFQALWLDFTRPQMVRAFQHLDRDGDAAIVQDEYLKPTSKLVEFRDRNGDGKITKDDFKRPEHDGQTVSPTHAPATKGHSK
jgi:Ca2+-binding EF-hand superfamily protein